MQNRVPEQGRVHRYWTRAAKRSPAPKYRRARYQSRVGVQLLQSRMPRCRAEQDVGGGISWGIAGLPQGLIMAMSMEYVQSMMCRSST